MNGFLLFLFYFYCAHCISEMGKAGQPAERIISQREGPRPSPCDDGSHVSGEPGGEFSELFTASAHASAHVNLEPFTASAHTGAHADSEPFTASVHTSTHVDSEPFTASAHTGTHVDLEPFTASAHRSAHADSEPGGYPGPHWGQRRAGPLRRAPG